MSSATRSTLRTSHQLKALARADYIARRSKSFKAKVKEAKAAEPAKRPEPVTVPSQPAWPPWASAEVVEAAQSLLSRRGSDERLLPSLDLRQLIDANQVQLQRLSLCDDVPLTLAEGAKARLKAASNEASGLLASASGPPATTTLLAGEHLCFFTPRIRSSHLGADGSDSSFNPAGAHFVRRMWGGGTIMWTGNPLRVGDAAREKTFIDKVAIKQTAAGDEMIVTTIKKQISNERGPSIIDSRSWLYRRQGDAATLASVPPPTLAEHPVMTSAEALGLAPDAMHVVQTRATLFRYSALTFNAHAIHLDGDWCRTRESQGDLVVHGPLTLALLLRKWSASKGVSLNTQGGVQGDLLPKKVVYRAMRPLLVGERCWIGQDAASAADPYERTLMKAVKDDGTVVMEATVYH